MVALLGSCGLDQNQMIKSSHNSRTFLNFLQVVKEYLWINYHSTINIVVLDNFRLYKVDLVVSEFPPIDKTSHLASHCLADCPMRFLFLPLKSWEKIAEFPIQGAKFDQAFPLLFGENKNKIKEKLGFGGRQTHLSSVEAPAATAQMPATLASTQPSTCLPARSGTSGPCQPPACPASCQPTCLLPGPQPTACHPPGSQGPPCNQSEISLEYSQSKKTLNTRDYSKTKIIPPEEEGNNGSDFKNKFATNQLDAKLQTTWAGSNSSQNNVLETKIDSEKELTHIPHLAPGQH
ncbi:hypothetical protein DSO57_1004043 [Entomophthora muscae]|uniref:Uncharacterized protein n=1 Tax=Entomophthora muscae TaxID=34485 RepID=A0ACC2U6U3_9FUNG|nr:hypothetical protein DSO57_1004043 [Entomophthora muscae]